MQRRGLLPLLLAQLLLFRWPRTQGQQYCGAVCQAAQQQALSALYLATGGDTWVSTTAIIVEPKGWPNTTSPGTGLPAHCYWTGVYCCVPSGLPAGLPQLVMHPNKAGNPYPSAKLVACSVLLGVATLSLSHTNLTGSIESLDLSALNGSLTRLDLSGAAAALLFVQAGPCSTTAL